MKILLVQQKMIGDVLLSSLLCEHLKMQYAGCEIHYLINEHTTAVVQNNPFIDTLVLFKKEYKNKWQLYKFLKAISKEKYDVVIDIYGKLESNLISLFSGAAIKISHDKWYTNFIYTHLISKTNKKESHIGLAIEKRLSFLEPILKTKIANPLAPKIYLSQTEILAAKNYLITNDIDYSKPILMLGILGSSQLKTYPLDYMAIVLDHIANQTNATLLFNYIPSQVKTAEQLYQLCTSKTKLKIRFTVFAPSLRDFLALLSHCTALIGNEGGAINMAKALNVSTFSIYAPWISKAAWHTFNNQQQNAAVHLADFTPKRFSEKTKKELKKETPALYKLFKPELFLNQLTNFLNAEVSSNK